MALTGLVVGLIARAVLPGAQTIGVIFAAVLGIAGACLAAFVGHALGWYGNRQPVAMAAAAAGSMAVVFIIARLKH